MCRAIKIINLVRLLKGVSQSKTSGCEKVNFIKRLKIRDGWKEDFQSQFTVVDYIH